MYGFVTTVFGSLRSRLGISNLAFRQCAILTALEPGCIRLEGQASDGFLEFSIYRV